jgi:hypothetical protein
MIWTECVMDEFNNIHPLLTSPSRLEHVSHSFLYLTVLKKDTEYFSIYVCIYCGLLKYAQYHIGVSGLERMNRSK